MKILKRTRKMKRIVTRIAMKKMMTTTRMRKTKRMLKKTTNQMKVVKIYLVIKHKILQDGQMATTITIHLLIILKH